MPERDEGQRQNKGREVARHATDLPEVADRRGLQG